MKVSQLMVAILAERDSGRKNRDLSAQDITATLAAICAPRAERERVTG